MRETLAVPGSPKVRFEEWDRSTVPCSAPHRHFPGSVALNLKISRRWLRLSGPYGSVRFLALSP